MTEYYEHEFSFSKGQIAKILGSLKKGCKVTVRLTAKTLQLNSAGNVRIPLNKMQTNKLNKAKTNKKGIQLTFSLDQLKKVNIKKEGGFLPLLALLPAALGAIGGLAGGITSAVNSSKQTAEQKRHNEIMESIAKGSGIISNSVEGIPLIGKSLSQALEKIGLGGCIKKNLIGIKMGEGLYLEPGGSGLNLNPQGSGLYLNPKDD